MLILNSSCIGERTERELGSKRAGRERESPPTTLWYMHGAFIAEFARQ